MVGAAGKKSEGCLLSYGVTAPERGHVNRSLCCNTNASLSKKLESKHNICFVRGNSSFDVESGRWWVFMTCFVDNTQCSRTSTRCLRTLARPRFRYLLFFRIKVLLGKKKGGFGKDYTCGELIGIVVTANYAFCESGSLSLTNPDLQAYTMDEDDADEIRMKDGVPLWGSDCLRLKTAEAFLSSPGTFHLQ